MATDPPPQSLLLSDIMHTMSPSPTSQNLESSLETGRAVALGMQRSLTPEPLQEEEIVKIRSRTIELFPLDQGGSSSASSRERELMDMIIRLTAAPRPDPSQLLAQAETISGLVVQRDFILKQLEDQRARWEAEREGWERSAEALIAQRNKGDYSASKGAELERQYSLLESDNRALRDKLQDTQARLTSLEVELLKLKPILLMQSHIPRMSTTTNAQSTSQSQNLPVKSSLAHTSAYLSSIPYPSLTGAGAAAAQKARMIRTKKKDREMKVPPPTTLHEDTEMNDEDAHNANTQVANHDTDQMVVDPPHADSVDQAAPAANSTSNTDAAHLPEGPSSSTAATGSSDVRTQAKPAPSGGHYRNVVPDASVQPYEHLRPQSSTSQPVAGPSTLTHTQMSPKRSRPPKPKPKGPPPFPLSSDARNEHLLLAARKLGRERVSIMAGLQIEIASEQEREAEREKELREREKEARANTSHYRRDPHALLASPPKTPKRGAAPGAGPGHHMHAGMPGGVGGSPTRGTLHPAFVPMFMGSPGVVAYPQMQMHTPGRQIGRLQQAQNPGSPQKGPHTPLDSLLSAARSMMSDDGGSPGSPGGGIGTRRKANALEQPDSPLQKKRRVATNHATPGTSSSSRAGAGTSAVAGNSGGSRVRSALDVLADQAAAYGSTDEQGARGKGKGKEVAPSKPANAAVGARKPRARPKAADRKVPVQGLQAASGSATPRMISPRMISPPPGQKKVAESSSRATGTRRTSRRGKSGDASVEEENSTSATAGPSIDADVDMDTQQKDPNGVEESETPDTQQTPTVDQTSREVEEEENGKPRNPVSDPSLSPPLGPDADADGDHDPDPHLDSDPPPLPPAATRTPPPPLGDVPMFSLAPPIDISDSRSSQSRAGTPAQQGT